MESILRQKNGIALVSDYDKQNELKAYKVYKDVNPESVVTTDNGNGNIVYNRFVLDGNKEVAYMYALSKYLEQTGDIYKSYPTLENEQQNIEYCDLFKLCKRALRELKENDLLDNIEIDEEEKELFGVADTVLLKEYTVRKVLTLSVKVAVDKDADDSEIERKLEDYADEQENYKWDFESYECELDDEEEDTVSNATCEADLDLVER